LNFRNDFFEIDDYDKNDALYYSLDENANNQFLVMFNVKSLEGSSPETDVQEKWNQYLNGKIGKMLAYKRLVKLLKAQIQKKEVYSKLKNLSLKPHLRIDEYNWICLSEQGNFQELIKQAKINEELLEVVEGLIDLQNQFLNILNNHYTIRHSLDTHFVTSKLNKIEKILKEAREQVSEQILNIKYSQVSSWLIHFLGGRKGRR